MPDPVIKKLERYRFTLPRESMPTMQFALGGHGTQGFHSSESMKTYVMTCVLTWKARGYNMVDKLFSVLEAT